MNIIFICAELPYPANSGGRIYTWKRLEQLSKKHDIYLFAIKEKEENVEFSEFHRLFTDTKIYDRGNKYISAMKNIFKPMPVASRYNEHMYNDIKKLIETDKIDLIVIDMPEVIINCPLDNEIPRVLTQHNIEYKLFKDIADNTNNYIKKIIYTFESIKMKRYEESIYNNSLIDGYTFISESNMEEFVDIFGVDNVVCIPPGYDVDDYINERNNTNTIIFTGKMDYEPNVQAVLWFSKFIFPNIQKELPDSKFYIVGKNPTKEVVSLQENTSIVVTGIVDDINQYLRNADLYVIPLLSGDGVKIKLFEALGSGKIVVSTSKGIEGTNFINNEHIIIADDHETFSNRCIEVLKNIDTYSNLPINAMNVIRDNYSWGAIGETYNDFLLSICSEKRYSIAQTITQ